MMNETPINQIAIRMGHARELMERGQLNQAREIYEDLYKQYTQDAEINYMLGCTHGRLGNLTDAVRYFKQCIKLEPSAYVAHYDLGKIYTKLGNYTAAEKAFHEALELKPNNVNLILDLAKILRIQGKRTEADERIQAILALKPGSPKLFHRVGEYYHADRQFKNAISYFKRALSIEPDRADTYKLLAHSEHYLGRFDAALSYYNQAVLIDPDFSEAYMEMGYTLIAAGQSDESRAAFQKALEINSENMDATAGIIKLLEQEGRFKEAYDRLSNKIKSGVTHPLLAVTYINICRHFDSCNDAIKHAEKILGKNNLPTVLKEQLHYALGNLHDRLGYFDTAFAHYQRANESRPDNFNAVELISVIDALIEVFSWKFKTTAPRSSIRSERPIFIIGMPRSGTSLTEQVLASHPDVFGAGELVDIANMQKTISNVLGQVPGYPFIYNKLNKKLLDNLARNYLDHITGLNNSAARVTDKMPQNFMYLGLINLLFPDARVIHCMRDPLDTCLSIYFQNFNEGHAYANKLEHIGLYYLQYKKLMQHYKAIIDLPILEVSYESLVNRQEKVSKQIIEFAGLEWNDKCLESHRTNRFIATSSYGQVRRKLYSSSIERWKNYEKHLDPLKHSLGMNQSDSLV